jgi:hypothetical protein
MLLESSHLIKFADNDTGWSFDFDPEQSWECGRMGFHGEVNCRNSHFFTPKISEFQWFDENALNDYLNAQTNYDRCQRQLGELPTQLINCAKLESGNHATADGIVLQMVQMPWQKNYSV